MKRQGSEDWKMLCANWEGVRCSGHHGGAPLLAEKQQRLHLTTLGGRMHTGKLYQTG